MAFTDFVTIAHQRLTTGIRQAGDDEYGSHEANEFRHSFVNVVIAAGKRFEISEFSELDLPAFNSFGYSDYQEIKSRIDHYMTQIALDTTIRSRASSTKLSDKSKDRIKSHLHHLREAVRSANLSDAKKDKLEEIISSFEIELEKKRLRWSAVVRLTLEMMAVPGGLYASYDVVTKLVTNINQTVAEAKAVEDETRQLPVEQEPFALTPPKTPKPKPQSGFGGPVDDEIPF
ncbi:hypothetical protein [Roseibium aggregatum]|uniref:hypothetical protein n=1 Tax=Roseibium aggregatum TaxID=187304 RepID=UPI001E489A40|nr:hypothetical protein [Roseibium aggregatum]UES37521.1 hypothetical protein GFC08_06390 [Roseibium aggregatum]